MKWIALGWILFSLFGLVSLMLAPVMKDPEEDKLLEKFRKLRNGWK